MYKGLSRDTRPLEQPEGTYPYGKNGVIDERGIHRNEPGLKKMLAKAPFTPIGVVETPKYPVLISTNNINTAIGYYNTDTDAYVNIVDDIGKTWRFPFNTGYPICTAQAQLNYKQEVVIAFSDANTFPMYLNCDNPNVDSLDDLRLFPLFNAGDLDVKEEGGGAHLPGSYFFALQYQKKDGTETSSAGIWGPYTITGTANQSSGKAFRLKFTALDQNYDQIKVSIVSKINGIFTASSLVNPVDIGNGGTATVLVTGADITEEALLTELVAPPVRYAKVGAIGQLNDALYLSDLTTEPSIDLQRLANLVKVRWVSQLYSLSPVPDDILKGRTKGFMHREVYALYIQYSKVGGGWTEFFPMIGPAPRPQDLLASAEASAQGITAKVFQTEDTIPQFFGTSGAPGVWINDVETYPDKPGFDSTTLGGEDLRNQPVRHFRMPSIQWCKDNLYTYEAEYGKSKLDLLGLEISNVIIPEQYKATLDGGYRIAYARRSSENSTVIGQSMFLQAARAHTSPVGTPTSPDTNYTSTGGNWGALVDWDGSGDHPLAIDTRLFRFHSFDMLFNRPSVQPAYMAFELKLRRTNLPYSGGLIEDYSITPGSKNGPVVYLIDYLDKGLSPLSAPSGKRIRKITESSYLPANLSINKWRNLMQEGAYVGTLGGTPMLDAGELAIHSEWTGPSYLRPDKAVQFENTWLCNLMNLPTDLFAPYNAQSLVFAGKRQTGVGQFWGGDVFISDYSFHTYGWHDSLNDDYALRQNAPLGGIRVARRFVCESISNINARFETPGNIYSKWFPNSPLTPQDPNNYILLFERTSDPNQFGYTSDLNAVNDLNPYNIFNPAKENITEFPFRIHRTGKLSKATKLRSWRSILALDYYELEKRFGRVVHMEGMEDRLLIHCMYALLSTRDKAKLDAGVLSVTLGTGDIFQFEPQEAMPAKLGYAGTQHKLSCVRTPVGYVFIDDNIHEMFMYSQGRLEMITGDLRLFLREYLSIKSDNPFVGNGYTIGYDQKYKRILLTAKNNTLPDRFLPGFVLTAETVNTLVPGDVILHKGQYMVYKGLNTSEYACTANIVPTVTNLSVTTGENTALGTKLINLSSSITDFTLLSILSGGSKFALLQESGSWYLQLTDALDYETATVHTLTLQATSIDGETANFIITVNVTDQAELPVSGNQSFEIDENTINGTAVGTVIGTNVVSYAIIGGSGAFAINSSTGVITVADDVQLNFEVNPLFLLTVRLTNGAGFVDITVTISLRDMNEAPEIVTMSLEVEDTAAIGTVIGRIVAIDPENGPVTFSMISNSIPGTLDVNATTGEVTVEAALNAETMSDGIELVVSATDNVGNIATQSIIVNVLFYPGNLEIIPSTPACTGTTRSWGSIQIKNLLTGNIIATFSGNVPGNTYQRMQIPYYPPVPNVDACGGANTIYFSAVQSRRFAKNDCGAGIGVPLFYARAKGSFVSTVSQVDADDQALTAVLAEGQAYANTYGSCI